MSQRREQPPHFVIGGNRDHLPTVGPTFEYEGQTFNCLPWIGGATLFRVARIVSVDERGRAVNHPDVLQFMEDVICEELPVMRPAARVVEGDDSETPVDTGEEVEVWEPCDDLARWRALMDDKRRAPLAEDFGEIVKLLLEYYTSLPTRPSGR